MININICYIIMELNVKEAIEMLGAIRNSDYDTVERLLQEGVNPNKELP